ncbi:hypothetical protein KJ590_02055 [Patescibacteria group bacterium]|nr:hypothetical protein [Patescibacteria group bacterium]
MKKLVVLISLISFLLIVVGAAAQATAAEEFLFGTWNVPWDDGPATIQIKNESSVPGTVIVVYSWGSEGNGVCAQARIYDSTLTLNLWDETIIILRASGDSLVGEKHSTTRLQRVVEVKEGI